MELLIRIVDKVNLTSPKLDAKCMKAGDVIAAKPAGSSWGVKEIQNPEWRIIKVGGLPPTLDRDYPRLRKRAMRLDLDALDIKESGNVKKPKPNKDPKTPDEVKALAVDVVSSAKNIRDCEILKTRL